MISALLFLCAEHTIRDAETNKVSAINILDGISAESFPALLPNLNVLMVLERDVEVDPDEFAGTFELLIGSQQLVSFPIKGTFTGKRRVRQFIGFGGLVLPAPGTILARAKIGDLNLEYRFELEQRPSPIKYDVVNAPDEPKPTTEGSQPSGNQAV